MGTHTISRRPAAMNGEGDVRSVLDSIRRIVRALRVSSRAAEKDVGLSGAQLFVLQKLADGGAALSINELAERTVTDQSSVSVIVQKLAKRGMVNSARSTEDGRRIEMTLTPAGRKVIARSSGAAQERLIKALRAMPAPRRRQLAHLLDELVHQAGISADAATLFFEHEDGERGVQRSSKDTRHGTSR